MNTFTNIRRKIASIIAPATITTPAQPTEKQGIKADSEYLDLTNRVIRKNSNSCYLRPLDPERRQRLRNQYPGMEPANESGLTQITCPHTGLPSLYYANATQKANGDGSTYSEITFKPLTKKQLINRWENRHSRARYAQSLGATIMANKEMPEPAISTMEMKPKKTHAPYNPEQNALGLGDKSLVGGIINHPDNPAIMEVGA